MAVDAHVLHAFRSRPSITHLQGHGALSVANHPILCHRWLEEVVLVYGLRGIRVRPIPVYDYTSRYFGSLSTFESLPGRLLPSGSKGEP